MFKKGKEWMDGWTDGITKGLQQEISPFNVIKIIPISIPFPFSKYVGNKYLQSTYYCVRNPDWTMQQISSLQLPSREAYNLKQLR